MSVFDTNQGGIATASTFPSQSTPDENQLCYWLALWRIQGVGSIFFQRMLARFGDPSIVFQQDAVELAVLGFSEKAIAQIRNVRNWASDTITVGVERDLDWMARDHHHILAWNDPRYPPLLKTIHDAPPLLFVTGSPHYLSDVQVAIVGSRHPSRVGVENAAAFSGHLVDLGIVPTSGLALGIDGAAHQAAVDKGQPTIAVAGNGLDIVYPKKHTRLAEQIAEYGALVSEFGTGVAPQASHFPRRNRIISGLSVGVLVVEAALKSGSLITARLAMEQGREVFSIPGSIHNPMAKGCHALIREGAKLVESAEHILEEVQSLVQLQAEQQQIKGISTQKLAKPTLNTKSTLNKSDEEPNELDYDKLDSVERCIVAQLSFEPIPMDLLIERCQLQSQQLASVLVMLEIRGYVVTEPGGYCLPNKWIQKTA